MIARRAHVTPATDVVFELDGNASQSTQIMKWKRGSSHTGGIQQTGVLYSTSRGVSYDSNTLFGWGVGNSASFSGTSNAIFGTGATVLTSGSLNTLMGAEAGSQLTTGNYNVAIGYQSNFWCQTGDGNIAIGYLASFNNTSSYNVSVGLASLYGTTSGAYNTAIGLNSGRTNTTGSFNTSIGYQAGFTGTSNNLSNATCIGAEAQCTQSNSIILGGTGATYKSASDLVRQNQQARFTSSMRQRPGQ